MSVLAPLSLLALIGVPLIVLFHMRHTTPPRRYVGSLRFWQAADPRPAEERRLRRPPLSLPLLLQILAVALLAFALARPATASQIAAIAPGLHGEPQHLLLLLDGSTSMAATPPGATQSRWESARQEALARLAPLREGDVVTFMLLGAHPLTETASSNAGLVSLRQRLTNLPLPGGRVDLDAALALAADLRLPNLERSLVLISDGAVTVDPGVAAGTGATITLVVPGEETEDAQRGNLAVTQIAVRPATDGSGTLTLFASLANYGAEQVETSVTVIGDGLDIGRGETTLAAGGEPASLQWVLPPGVGEIRVRIEAMDQLPADNTATILPLSDDAAGGSIAPHILLVTDLPGALARALMSLDNVQVSVEPADNVAAISAANYDLAVFDRVAQPADLVERLPAPSLWIAPPAAGPFPTTEDVTEPEVSRVRAGDPLLEGVDLAGVTFGPTATFTLGPDDTEIVGAGDGPLLYQTQLGTQPALVLTPDPEASNLPKRVAFPILVANMVNSLAPDGIPAAVPLGESLVYTPRAATSRVEITPPQGEPVELAVAETNATDRDVVFTGTGEPGIYTVTEYDAFDLPLGSTKFVVNAGHRLESDLRVDPNLVPALATATGVSTSGLREERVDLWPILALAALGVIVLEWLWALWAARTRVRRATAATT
ncbi:MAG: BatA domain-containing protein [Chloroflexota bacterium]|nr:BatA domain-containing protein [Chloroflexota bacterium]